MSSRAGMLATMIDRDDPAENQPENLRENHVRITRDVEEIEIAVDQTLRAHDPEADRRQA